MSNLSFAGDFCHQHVGLTTIESAVASGLEAVNAVVPGAGTSFAAGLARFPEEAGDAEGLSRLADQRLYAAKSR